MQKVLTWSEVKKRVPLRKGVVDRLEANSLFPKRLRVCRGSIVGYAWYEHEIELWEKAQLQKSVNEAICKLNGWTLN